MPTASSSRRQTIIDGECSVGLLTAIDAINPVAALMDANDANTLLGDQHNIAEIAEKWAYGDHKSGYSDDDAYGYDKPHSRGVMSHDVIASRDPASGMSNFAALVGDERLQLKQLSHDRSAASSAEHSSHIDSVAFELDAPIAWSPFSIWLSLLLHAHGDRILRFKTIISVSEWDAPVSLDAVHHIVYPPRHLARRSSALSFSRFVFIAQDLDVSRIAPSLRAFLARHSARSELSATS